MCLVWFPAGERGVLGVFLMGDRIVTGQFVLMQRDLTPENLDTAVETAALRMAERAKQDGATIDPDSVVVRVVVEGVTQQVD